MCFLDPLKPDHPVNAGTQEISVVQKAMIGTF